jgi:DNA-binding NarL/FixJ family response regulator
MARKIMIVEDHEEMQLLYAALFVREPDLAIVAQEDSAEKALRAMTEKQPDLVMIDITLPGMSGLELTRQIHQRFPAVKLLVVTAHDPDRYLSAAREAGADNLITKDSAAAIVDEVRRLLS